MDKISTQVTTVVAAAATAAGTCPENANEREAWQARVRTLAELLWAEAAALQAHAGVVAKEITLTGTLTEAGAHPTNGRGKVVVRTAQGRGPDAMWTGFLSDPGARSLLEQAKSLVGRRVEVRKRIEREGPDSTVTHPRLLSLRPVDEPGDSGESTPSTADELVHIASERLGLDATYVKARARELLGPPVAGRPRTAAEVAKVWDALRLAPRGPVSA